jgi:hypothetical protein
MADGEQYVSDRLYRPSLPTYDSSHITGRGPDLEPNVLAVTNLVDLNGIRFARKRSHYPLNTVLNHNVSRPGLSLRLFGVGLGCRRLGLCFGRLRLGFNSSDGLGRGILNNAGLRFSLGCRGLLG